MRGYRVTDTDLAQWGELFPAARSASAIRNLPMVEASALNGGTPGAAWKACLDNKVQASHRTD